jgi:hypothetical protein
LGAPVALFFFVASLLLIRNKWTAMMVVTISFTELCMSFATYWENSHYAASLTPCFFLIAVQGFRYFWASATTAYQRKLTLCLLVALSLASAGFQWISYLATDYPDKNQLEFTLYLDQKNVMRIPDRVTYLKPIIESAAAESGEQFLAVVSYEKGYSRHDEIVFNGAELESQPLIWANDLGNEKNDSLLNHFKNRKILSVKIAGSNLVITPLAQ